MGQPWSYSNVNHHHRCCRHNHRDNHNHHDHHHNSLLNSSFASWSWKSLFIANQNFKIDKKKHKIKTGFYFSFLSSGRSSHNTQQDKYPISEDKITILYHYILKRNYHRLFWYLKNNNSITITRPDDNKNNKKAYFPVITVPVLILFTKWFARSAKHQAGREST